MERKPLKYPKPALAYEATPKELALFLKDRDVAAEIGRHYRNSNASLANAVSERLECGRLLIGQKDSLAHGQWLPWLKANAKMLGFSSERTAQMLMKGAANTKLASHLDDEPGVVTASRQLWGHDKPKGRSVVPRKQKGDGWSVSRDGLDTYVSPDIDEETPEGQEEFEGAVSWAHRACMGLAATVSQGRMPDMTAKEARGYADQVIEAISYLESAKDSISRKIG